ncbi:MAG: caspase family protein, partial [Cyanobacteria bacterium J06643_5]
MSKIALLIGVSEYQPGLNTLPSAVRDVEAMRRVLVNSEMGGFIDSDVTVLKNPRPDDIRYAIYELFSNRQKDDLLLFYFSGHGIKDEKGNLYFATRHTRKDNGKLVKPSAVAARTLHENINDSRSQRQVIILDCCFSGAIATGMSVKDDGNVNVEEQLGGKGRAILTSSTSTQYSFEQQDSELSVYTRYLVEGIDTGAADTDGDGQISIDELYEYANGKVREAYPAMTPEFYPVKEGHKILLAKSPKDDPSLIYRQEVEIRAQESQGNFSIFTLRILEGKRQELNISLEEANVIKEEVLQPYKEYERKLYEYEQALIEAVKKQYPFSEILNKEIKEYQQYLGLRDEDIIAIDKRVLAPKQAEYERILEAKRLKQEQERAEFKRQQDKERQQQQEKQKFESSRKYKSKLRRYQEEFFNAVEFKYPLNEIARSRLKNLQQLLELNDEDVAQIEKLILDEKEIEEQEKLKEIQKQKEVNKNSAEYKYKVRRYKEEFFKEAEIKYPLNESARNLLKNFQQFLKLSDEDVAQIEKPILDEKELEKQQKLQRMQEQEDQKKSQRYKYKVQRYKEEFLKAIEAKYPLNEFIRNRLNNLQQFLGLSDEDVAQIEKPILNEKKLEEQQKLKRIQEKKEVNTNSREYKYKVRRYKEEFFKA